MKFARAGSFVIAAAVVILSNAGIAHAQCGPMDVVFIIDNSGSMDPVIDQVKTQVEKIADSVQSASGGDYRFALVTMPANDVNIVLDMSANNRAALDTAVQQMATSPSAGLGIAYDEALDAVLNHLGPRKGSIGQQTGTFAAQFRPGATKIIMVITDTGPQGFDSTLGTHAQHAFQMASEAATLDIRIVGIFVPDGGGVDQAIDEPILQNVAAITQGEFEETASDASDLANAIIRVVNSCGVAQTLSLDPTQIVLHNQESADVKVTNFSPGDTKTLIYTSSGLPADSTVTFTRINQPNAGTDLQNMHVTIGSDTQAGTYSLCVSASHTTGGRPSNACMLVIVDCEPPQILGVNQLANRTVTSGQTATLKIVPLGSTPLRYQWYSGHSGFTSSPISAANTDTLQTSQITGPSEFWVRVSNPCGSVDSQTTTITPHD